jgi:hypothetical protein
MWSRLNVVGLRRRWGSLQTAPGRSARRDAPRRGSDLGNGRSSAAESVKVAFLAKEILIDCPRPGCVGKLLMSRRRFGDTAGTGSRVVLHCTRGAEDHEVTITMEPYTTEEKEELEALQSMAKTLRCRRCDTSLELGSVEVQDAWTDSVNSEAAYYCPWCGLKWLLPGGVEYSHAG